MEFLPRLLHWPQKTLRSLDLKDQFHSIWNAVNAYLQFIRSIGNHSSLHEYERRKLGIFNLLNFFQLITGILIPVACLVSSSALPLQSALVAMLPACVSVLVLWLNGRYLYEYALLAYFVFYPVFTCIIYMDGMNLGVELYFVLYGILSVFFFQDIGYMVFSVALSMMSYLILSVFLKNYQYQLKSLNINFYLLNQLVAMAYIFYGLYLVKRENSVYQSSIVHQKAEISEQAELLKLQADELTELNQLNNKLFSVISHDLKAPMYALRNFFQSAKDMKLSARELKGMLPDVINDLNYTTGLMENLLHWAKSQLHSNEVRAKQLDINAMVREVISLLRLQADNKQIRVERKTDLPAYAFADPDMVNLVLRNLLSNAIKYTNHGGTVVIGTHEYDGFTEVYVRDTGVGICQEAMQKINQNTFYSTSGTSSESGTGLGLNLCKEFLARNGGRMMIESEPGRGSTFSFTLPQT